MVVVNGAEVEFIAPEEGEVLARYRSVCSDVEVIEVYIKVTLHCIIRWTMNNCNRIEIAVLVNQTKTKADQAILPDVKYFSTWQITKNIMFHLIETSALTLYKTQPAKATFLLPLGPNRLALISDDRSCQIYHLATHKLLREFMLPGVVRRAISLD